MGSTIICCNNHLEIKESILSEIYGKRPVKKVVFDSVSTVNDENESNENKYYSLNSLINGQK